MTEAETIAMLRAALAYYCDACFVLSWGSQETEDDGGVARYALNARQAGSGSYANLAAGLEKKQADCAAAKEKLATLWQRWNDAIADEPDDAAYRKADKIMERIQAISTQLKRLEAASFKLKTDLVKRLGSVGR